VTLIDINSDWCMTAIMQQQTIGESAKQWTTATTTGNDSKLQTRQHAAITTICNSDRRQ